VIKIFIFTILLSNLSFAQSVINMNCSNNQCVSTELASAQSSCSAITTQSICESKIVGNVCQWVLDNSPLGGSCTSLPQTSSCLGYNCPIGDSISSIKMRGFLSSDISVSAGTSGVPQNLGISVNSGSVPGKNLTINLSSPLTTAKGGSVLVIGDTFNNVSVNLDGYNGKKGKNSSEICADRIKNGDYGVALQNYFNNRRATTSADPNKCDADDLNYMQTFNFSCDDPAYQEISVSNPVVQVNQVKKMARCNAVASYNLCLKKKINVTCNFRLWSSFRQQFLTDGTFLENPSYTMSSPICNNQLTSCGSVTATCQPQGGFFFNQPTLSNPECTYNSSGGSFDFVSLCSPYYYGGQVSYQGYKNANVCVISKNAGMPLTKTTNVGPIDEEFYLSEANRLGGNDKFCDVYGQIPAKSNADWWAGVPGYASNSYVNGVESNGIPWEVMGSNQTGTEPAGAIPSWKTETQQNGGYNPVISSSFDSTTFAQTFKTKASYWKGASASYSYTSPGLNPDGLSLASGSNWELSQTNIYENCPTNWSVLKTFFLNLVQYTNKENTACTGISDPQDPNNRAFWQYTGIVQDSSFGTETVSCGIGTCAVNSSVSDLSRQLDTIVPGDGESGTVQGKGLLFVYDIKNSSTRALSGGAGSVGNADISINPQTRICAKIDDATAGITTEQAKSPFVSFRRYSWQALKSTTGANPGSNPPNTGNGVEIFKKIDPGIRYILDKSLMN